MKEHIPFYILVEMDMSQCESNNISNNLSYACKILFLRICIKN